MMRRQKSAEAIVVEVHRWAAARPTHRRRAELFEPLDAEHSMSDSRRRPKAEMPERRPRVGGGTAEGKPHARQTDTACDDHAGQPVLVTMEEGLNRENMLQAYHRVVANEGAPGVDGITVDELAPLLRERWEAIREELLSGQCVPNPVRKVETPKPGGKGVRMLGIPITGNRRCGPRLSNWINGCEGSCAPFSGVSGSVRGPVRERYPAGVSPGRGPGSLRRMAEIPGGMLAPAT